MTVSAETYIVISLMFAVFAAVAAVGTSVVLGAGFERLRAGFDHIKRQSGFFADAIYRLDQRTQKLDEETTKLKSGMTGIYDRMDRVEKQTTFIADAVNTIEERILQGSPTQPADQPKPKMTDGLYVMHTSPQARQESVRQPKAEIHGFVSLHNPVLEDDFEDEAENLVSSMFDDDAPLPGSREQETLARNDVMNDNEHDAPGGISTLLSRYFTGDNSKGVIYH